MSYDDPSTYELSSPPAMSTNYYKMKRAPQTAAPTIQSGGSATATTTVASSAQAVTLSPTSTGTSSPTSTSTSVSTSNSTQAFTYIQLAGHLGNTTGYAFPPWEIAAANYSELCPDGNCITDCQNVHRVFSPVPQGVDIDESVYGKATPKGIRPNITLFGVCSNLDVVSQLAVSQASNNSAFASYFPTPDIPLGLRNVSNDMSMCLFDTCRATRDPSQCISFCSLDNLQATPTSISIGNGVYPCLFQLCRNTCGLPYANQDVYGVGVLASYIMQALLVLLLAVGLIGIASWRFFKKHDNNKLVIPKRMRESMDMFLAAECFFGIVAAVASYRMSPSTVDPLNGYALLSVAITGFLPPVFTLMLLHSHGVRSFYTLFLTLTTFIFSSVLFWMLYHNLTQSIKDPDAINRGLDSLFNVDSCGQTSAMSLCKQAFDTDPLAYLSWFYNYWSIPSISTVPILWAFSAAVLLVLFVLQVVSTTRRQCQGQDHLENQQLGEQSRQRSRRSSAINLVTLYIGTILFGLALGYQACMVLSYTRMDVINWSGWSFGQIVALLFWLPPLLDSIRAYVMESKREKLKKKLTAIVAEQNRNDTDNASMLYYSKIGSINTSASASTRGSTEKEPATTKHEVFHPTRSPSMPISRTFPTTVDRSMDQGDQITHYSNRIPDSSSDPAPVSSEDGAGGYLAEPLYETPSDSSQNPPRSSHFSMPGRKVRTKTISDNDNNVIR